MSKSTRKINLICIRTIIMVIAIWLLYNAFSSAQTLAKVKSGEYTLLCGITSWQKNELIDPNIVIDYDLDHDSWTFKNGYSRNCKLVINKEQ